jgi:hypothetical protein
MSPVRPELRFRADFSAIVGRAHGLHSAWMVRLKQIAIDLVKGLPVGLFESTFRR